MKSLFNRRNLLRGAGAATALSCFASYFRKLAIAQEGAAPKRCIIFWTPNGVVQDAFWPGGTGGANLTLSPLLKPLEDHKADLTILKGVRYAGTGDHKTGQPFSTTGFTNQNEGISIDQEIAGAIGQSPLVLAGQSKNGIYRGYISQDAGGAWVAPWVTPQKAYESVFGPITGAGPSTPPVTGPDAELQNAILDTAIADIESLKPRLPSAELVKMEDHLDAILSLKSKLGGPGGGTVTCDNDGTPWLEAPDMATRVKLHMDLIAACIACDARRVFSFMMGPGGHDNCNFGFLGVSGGDLHNDIAHNSDSDPAQAEKMKKIEVWQAEQFAYLLTALKRIPEGGGTAFDNTVVLWTTECTRGNHGHWDIPLVMAGSAGGFLKTGQYLQGERQYENLLITLAHAMGHPLTTFGAKGTGPLAELIA